MTEQEKRDALARFLVDAMEVGAERLDLRVNTSLAQVFLKEHDGEEQAVGFYYGPGIADADDAEREQRIITDLVLAIDQIAKTTGIELWQVLRVLAKLILQEEHMIPVVFENPIQVLAADTDTLNLATERIQQRNDPQYRMAQARKAISQVQSQRLQRKPVEPTARPTRTRRRKK